MRVALLGESIVLFLDAKGAPAALRDRCCHGIAKRQLEAMTNASVAIKYNVINSQIKMCNCSIMNCIISYKN